MITNYILKVNSVIFANNPFFQSYILSDWFGRLIFIGLYLLSIISWIIIIYKLLQIYQARQNARHFREEFFRSEANPLKISYTQSENKVNPFFILYSTVRKQTISILNKNQQHKVSNENSSSQCYLSGADLDFVQAHLATASADQIQRLDKNLFVLSTTVSLAPFLGLLGTVWGILITFSSLQNGAASAVSNQMFLGGLSLALATTVLGLLDAIPALIGYNYLKNEIRSFEIEVDSFSTELLAAIEMYYRKVDTH